MTELIKATYVPFERFSQSSFFEAYAGHFSKSAGASVGRKLTAGRWGKRILTIRKSKLRRMVPLKMLQRADHAKEDIFKEKSRCS